MKIYLILRIHHHYDYQTQNKKRLPQINKQISISKNRVNHSIKSCNIFYFLKIEINQQATTLLWFPKHLLASHSSYFSLECFFKSLLFHWRSTLQHEFSTMLTTLSTEFLFILSEGLKMIIILIFEIGIQIYYVITYDIYFLQFNHLKNKLLSAVKLFYQWSDNFYYILISKDRNFINMSMSQTLAKFIAFVQYHQIEFDQIWNDSPSLPLSKFVNIMEVNFDYHFNKQEIQCLNQISHRGQYIMVQSFHSIGLWTNISYNTNYAKFSKYKQKGIRPQTAKLYREKLNKNETENILTQKNKLFQSSINQNMKNSRFNQSNDVLQKKIIENALDKKWEYLIKVGEMNTWQKSIKNTNRSSTKKQLNFNDNEEPIKKKKVYKIQGNDQNIQIIQQKQNGYSQILPLKVFDQKYQFMKKKCVIQQKSKNNMKGTMLLVLDKKDKVSKTKLCQKISQRDQQLNYLLLEIIRLKQIFGQQQQILTEYGVNS